MDIRFGDHPSFHKAALGMTLGALLLGLALHPVTPFAPLAAGLLGVALGASFAYGKVGARMLVAVAAVLPLVLVTPTWGLVAASASVIALALVGDVPGGRRRGVRAALGVVVGTGALLAGVWCAGRITGAQETEMWPPWLTSGLAAAAVGLVGVLAMLPRHLSIGFDPVRAAARRLPATLDPEVQHLCARVISIWTTTKSRLAGDDPGARLVRDGVLQTLEVAERSAAVELTDTGEAELGARMEDFERRIAAATDPEVKAQYEAARAALGDQRRYREHIRQGRERLVARMHNHVSSLEKFQLAATGLEAMRVTSTTATRQLDELSQEVAASGEALAELELGVPVSDSPTPAGAEPAATPTA